MSNARESALIKAESMALAKTMPYDPILASMFADRDVRQNIDSRRLEARGAIEPYRQAFGIGEDFEIVYTGRFSGVRKFEVKYK